MPTWKNHLVPAGKALLLMTWAVLFGLLLYREYAVRTVDPRETLALRKAAEQNFYGIYFRGGRIGYVQNRLTPADGGFRLREEAFLQLNVLGQHHPMRMTVDARLGGDFLLHSFEFSLLSPFYAMAAQGKVEGNTVHFSLSSGKQTSTDTLRLADPPYLSTQRRAYLLAQGLKEGERISIPFFDPVSLTGKATVFEYRGVKKELVQGRIVLLHHFIETFSGIRINSWLDDNGLVVKEESPAGFVFIAEPEFKATDVPGKTEDLLAAVAVPLQGRMPDLTMTETLRFRLVVPENTEFEFDYGRQRFSAGVLEVRREAIPTENSAVCPEQTADLAPTTYVQSNNPHLMKKSLEIAAAHLPPLEKVRKLAAWVHDNISKRPVIGVPDALATLQSGIGDCNEHAALFAALARSAGIPTRIAAGVTFMKNAFYYHAWNEICLDSGWISLDTTLGQLPADVGHLRFLHGEIPEQIRIVSLLGQLGIEVLPP